VQGPPFGTSALERRLGVGGKERGGDIGEKDKKAGGTGCSDLGKSCLGIWIRLDVWKTKEKWEGGVWED